MFHMKKNQTIFLTYIMKERKCKSTQKGLWYGFLKYDVSFKPFKGF
jgi:hypothetical protein